jgi:NAD(P)-dependent dehydrogenase (short-subunit alcohol dehydrogenase family)
MLDPAHKPVRSQRLAGQSAIVFGGGTSGPILSNGQAASIAYALAGAHVTVFDNHLERACATVEMVVEAGGSAEAVAGDVSSANDIMTGIRICATRLGRLDILHYNVGITEAIATTELTQEAWERAFAINTTGCFLAIKAVLPIMKGQRSGVITTISSVASIRYPNITYAAYAASKAAVNQLTQVVALEHAGDGIRANAILPGLLYTSLVQTQLADHYGDLEQAVAHRSAKCPMGFMGDAWDVANTAVFLASLEARYITGQTLIVDGGLSAVCG